MKYLIFILLLSCTPKINIHQGGIVTGIMLLEDDLCMYEYRIDGTTGNKKSDYGYFYDLKHTYNIESRIDSITAEQIYPELRKNIAKTQ